MFIRTSSHFRWRSMTADFMRSEYWPVRLLGNTDGSSTIWPRIHPAQKSPKSKQKSRSLWPHWSIWNAVGIKSFSRSCRKNSHRLLFSGWHGKQARLFATRWWWISCSLSEHICRATALFRSVSQRVRPKNRLPHFQRLLRRGTKWGFLRPLWFIRRISSMNLHKMKPSGIFWAESGWSFL